MGASANGRIDNANLLIEKGADLWKRSSGDRNSFDYMAISGQIDLLK
eukprot:CAMPEP_0205811244 /NCGR_PEP_ID=MMETSP0205-20121125/15414_1 /ASSEMBLY_ACC=CAM_ASM_000278 /TAXON_ID=36767 /ORGANISM="Euplotes focardii, Strain TN1" /LENGTH=46 /DNA_ID= /DNA_START= /DNA_END= /DNA_ORIENTATION=